MWAGDLLYGIGIGIPKSPCRIQCLLIDKLLKCANLKLAYKLLKQWRLPNCLEFRPTKIIFFLREENSIIDLV